MTEQLTEHQATGPRTPEGKAKAARNATSHGLFARDVVLTQLGEDPEGYSTLLQELTHQIKPKNLIEQHYIEIIAAASWRLRRLQRWQAWFYTQSHISEDDRFNKLDRLLRHETTLLRQIDKAVKLLARDVPELFLSRARSEALTELETTEAICAADPAVETQVTLRARQHLPTSPVSPEVDLATLDSAVSAKPEKCQNELSAAAEPLLPPDALHEDGRPVYLTVGDVDVLREMLVDDDAEGALEYMQECQSEYTQKYRSQEMTLSDILSELQRASAVPVTAPPSERVFLASSLSRGGSF